MNPTEESKDLSINSVTRSQHRHGWRARGLRSAFLLSAALAISQTTGAASADLKTKKLGPIGSVQIRDAADVPVGSYVGLESIRSSTYPIVAFDASSTIGGEPSAFIAAVAPSGFVDTVAGEFLALDHSFLGQPAAMCLSTEILLGAIEACINEDPSVSAILAAACVDDAHLAILVDPVLGFGGFFQLVAVDQPGAVVYELSSAVPPGDVISSVDLLLPGTVFAYVERSPEAVCRLRLAFDAPQGQFYRASVVGDLTQFIPPFTVEAVPIPE